MHEAFINSVKEIILKNIKDEHFGVSQLATEMGLSRSQLLRKIKSSTGKSTNHLVKEIRLREAAKLIREGKYTASEIAYQVGFNSPSYFNKCFHQFFKLTPGEFKEKQIENPNEIIVPKNYKSHFRKAITKRIYFVISVIIVSTLTIVFNRSIFPRVSSINQQASIAVLPFLNLSDNEKHDYLADGITEAIILELSKRKALRVISRTSAMRYKGEKELCSNIAKELGVNLLLEGSLLYSQDSLRLIVQLIEPLPNEKHIWSSRYDQKFEDVLQLVTHISNEIAHEINMIIFPNLSIDVNKKTNPQAYDLYLRGRHLWQQGNSSSVQRSIEYLDKSIKLDSTYAPAYATLAEAYISLNKLIRDNEKKIVHRGKSRTAINKALELDQSSGLSFITKGNICRKFDWDWAGMKMMAEKGLKLNPNNSRGHILLSDYYLINGDFKKSVSEALLAKKLDPLNPGTGCLLAERYYLANKYEKSITEYKKVIELFPNYGFAWDGIGYVQFITGQKKDAMKSWRRLQEIMGNDSIAQQFNILTYEQSFRYWLKKAKSKSPQYCSNPTIIAQVHMFLNENSEAMDYLEIAYKYKNEDLPLMLLRPHFKALHKDARFIALSQKLGVVIQP